MNATMAGLPEGRPVTDETPLFAADARYARLRGGAFTRTFIDALPTDWPREQVVVDSTLVWLSRGLVPNGWRFFHREAYPDQSGGAFTLANAELDTRHVSCFYGPSHAEVICGRVDLDALPPAIATSERTDLRPRHEALVAMIAAGRLGLEVMAEGVPFHYTAATFLRFTPAAESGFHLWLRATLGSKRPIVNGHRNVSNL